MAQALPAQTAAAPAASDPKAATILQQGLAAMTGGAPVADVTMRGTVTVYKGSAKESGTITMVATATGRSRTTTVLPSGTWVTIQDYSANPRTSVTKGPNGENDAAATQDLLGPSPAWFSPAMLIGAFAPQGFVASYVGQETRDGSLVHHVALWPQSANNSPPPSVQIAGQQLFTGPPRPGQHELYLDASSLLPQELVFRITGYRAKNGSPDLTRPMSAAENVRFSDHRQVPGGVAAFHIQMSIGGLTLMDIQLSSVSFNTGAAVAAH
jgi:hypothetical protein